MKASLQIGKIMGIPIRIHITFLFILSTFAYYFASGEKPFAYSDIQPISIKITFAVLTAVILFGCVLIHELGHSFIARRYGLPIRSITLLLFGGVAQIKEMPKDPNKEIKVALAGPLTSFALGGIFSLLYLFMSMAELELGSRIFFILLYFNIVIGAFNLIPALPMDGGRVFRGALVRWMPHQRATAIAVQVGKIFAIAFGLFGILFGNPWFIVIAFFVYIGATGEGQMSTMGEVLAGIKVREVMTGDVVTVSKNDTVEDLIQLMFERKHQGYPVINGSLLGVVTFKDIQAVPRERWGVVMVTDIMKTDVRTLSTEDEAFKALEIITKYDIGRVIVMDDGKLAGIISRSDILKSIELLRMR